MRLFFALWPDALVRERLTQWTLDCGGHCGGRATQPENLHATLAFLGEVEPTAVTSLVELAAGLRATAFDLAVDALAYWPHNRIVYAACSESPAALRMLAAAMRAELSALGFRTDARPYTAHVTLLRNARRAPPDAPVTPIHWQVREIALVQSLRQDGKLAYQPIERFTLAA